MIVKCGSCCAKHKKLKFLLLLCVKELKPKLKESLEEVDVILLRRDVLLSECNEAHSIRLKLTLRRLVERRDCLESKIEKCQVNICAIHPSREKEYLLIVSLTSTLLRLELCCLMVQHVASLSCQKLSDTVVVY